MEFLKEWKKNQITRADLNDELYEAIDKCLGNHLTDAVTSSRAYDAKLITRELVDNIYKHDARALRIGVTFEVKDAKVKIKVYHDGNDFDPFDDKSDCKIIKAIKYDYKFDAKFVGTDSGKYSVSFGFGLKEE